MKKHYETHVEDTDKLISVAGPVLDYKSWYEQYRKLMEEQAQRKYGLYTPTSEGDDDFPSISGMIARYSALGLTNEQMTENPVWKDLTGNGHDLQMKNFAWGGMSGVGGYGDENYQTFYKFTLDDYVFIASPPGVKHMNFTFRVTGLQPGNKLTLAFFGTTNTVYGIWDKDGIYTVDADIVEAGKPTYFYNGYGSTRGEFTIEILPLYPGALVFDGVDDYGVCENFPILTKEKGYTVVVLRQWDQDFLNTTLTGGLLSTRNYSTGEGVAFEKIESSNKGYWNLGAGGIIDFAKSPFTWQTSKQYNNVGILKGGKNHGKPLCVGCGLSGGQQCGRFAIWELVFLDHDATEEELTKIKDYFVKTYPWLFPDQAWTVTGKTNEDEDRATIANITGNGNNLVLSNFGFAGNSGYGEYAYNWNEWGLSKGVATNVSKQYNKFVAVMPVNQSVSTCSLYSSEVSIGTRFQFKLKITGLTTNWVVRVMERYTEGSNIIYEFDKDGTYQIDHTMTGSGNQLRLYIRIYCDVPNAEGSTVAVEQIPEYEGYLVTDGVDDSGRAANLTISKDFTMVGEWVLFSETSENAGISIHPHIHIFNRPDAIQIMFRGAGKTLPVKSLKAICSDGRCYDENWSELKINVGKFTDSRGTFYVANNGTNFSQTAFKNLGIYNDQLFSKEDCIKAYNYLQTLKSK